MPIPRYLDTLLEPLDSDPFILSRVGELIGTACARQTWMLFLDELDVQLPALIPIEDLPEHPGRDDQRIARESLETLVVAIAATSVIVVIERPGDDAVTEADAAWAGVWLRAGADAGIRVRATVLSHDHGVRWIKPDDIG